MMHNILRLLKEIKDFKKSKEHYIKALSIYRDIYDENHPWVKRATKSLESLDSFKWLKNGWFKAKVFLQKKK
ncbi:tetratricopeptide repeat protein [bacterium]|nr:tetratricopeptide repeat protein [bacterium]